MQHPPIMINCRSILPPPLEPVQLAASVRIYVGLHGAQAQGLTAEKSASASRLDVTMPACDPRPMSSRSLWLKRGSILFAGAVVLHGLAERRPEKLAIILMMAACFAAIVLIGWLFANRRER